MVLNMATGGGRQRTKGACSGEGPNERWGGGGDLELEYANVDLV